MVTWSMSRALLMAGVLAGAVLLGGMVGGPRLAAEEKKTATGLEHVPADGIAFVTANLAELRTTEAGKALLAPNKDTAELHKEFLKAVGIEVADLERVSLVLVDPPPRGEPVILLTTSKPLDREKVLAALAPGAAEEKRESGSVYLDREKNVGVFFRGERTVVVGNTVAVGNFAEHPAPTKETDKPLAVALALASGKHPVVVGVDMAAIAKEIGEQFPPELEPFKPLFQARTATLTLDLGAAGKLEAGATLNFAKEAEVKDAEKAANAALALAHEALSRVVKQAPKEMGKIVVLLEDANAALKTARVTPKDSTLQGSLSVKIDAPAVIPMLGQAVARMRQSAARSLSQNNLKQLALAMHNYHSTYGHFPAAASYDKNGKALLSWRVELLPYLEQQELYKQFKLDEPWDSPDNKKLLAKMPSVFAAPGSRGGSDTVYQGFTGKGTIFEGKKGIDIRDILDGTSNTIMFVEAANAVPWTKPEDLPYDPDKPLPKLGGLFPGGFNAALCDGSVRFVPKTVSEKTLRAAITRSGGEVLGPDW
jgi:hypothetical protein